jgi:peptide/nickel transport system ATP-binding protein
MAISQDPERNASLFNFETDYTKGEVIYSVKNLVVYFPLKRKLTSALKHIPPQYVHAIDGVSFDVHKKEIFGIVGESGCGKTTTGRTLVKLQDPTSGSLIFKGKNITTLRRGPEMREFRKKVQMVFQDPYESLNPRFTILSSVEEPLVVNNIGTSPEERELLVERALEDAGLKPASEYITRFPHELSGGQRQRVAIARSIVIRPEFIVADEPISMLDVSIRAGVMNLFLELRNKYNLTFVFITHDIGVARYMSDRIAVMYLGKIVEMGPTEMVIKNPQHPYTRALLSAVPVPDPSYQHGNVLIKGDLPNPINVPTGCRFNPRCLFAIDKCKHAEPVMREVEPGHLVYCHVDLTNVK